MFNSMGNGFFTMFPHLSLFGRTGAGSSNLFKLRSRTPFQTICILLVSYRYLSQFNQYIMSSTDLGWPIPLDHPLGSAKQSNSVLGAPNQT